MPHPRPRHFALGLTVVALVAVIPAAPLRPAHAVPRDGITFMETLEHWKYPGLDRIHGASMSDGGNPRIQSVKCRTVLTTPDPFEKVVAFYGAKAKAFGDEAKAVYSQDDSEGRPIQLRSIFIHRAESSTTLVISRAEGEKETHIAWSHYIRARQPL